MVSLKQKLGLGAQAVRIINPPSGYVQTLEIVQGSKPPYKLVQIFIENPKMLSSLYPKLKTMITKDGSLWISWPKGSDSINENIIREIGLKNGLVDVKVIAVDELWSGLKFVYRLKDRT